MHFRWILRLRSLLLTLTITKVFGTDCGRAELRRSDAPCTLPNSFVSDPPLKAVVSHTLEVGAAGKFDEALKWNFALCQTPEIPNDILFLNSPGSVINGFFRIRRNTTPRRGAWSKRLVLDTLELGIWVMVLSMRRYQTTAVLLVMHWVQKRFTPGVRNTRYPQIPSRFGAGIAKYSTTVFLAGDLAIRFQSVSPRGDASRISSRKFQLHRGYLNTRYVINNHVDCCLRWDATFSDNHCGHSDKWDKTFFQNNQTTQFPDLGPLLLANAVFGVHWTHALIIVNQASLD